MQSSFRKIFALLLFSTLAACGGEPESGPQVMTVKSPGETGAEASQSLAGSLAAGAYDRTIGRLFPEGLYYSVFVGRYLDKEPAERMAAHLRTFGLTTFVLEKRLSEEGALFNTDLGNFYLTMTGLFGEMSEAEILGKRLRAENLINSYQVVPVDHPGEIESTFAQNQSMDSKSARLSEQVAGQAGRPLGPESAAASGEAFKKNVYGRYVKSFRDPWAAEAEAAALTRAGWQASIERDGVWHRVYLSPTDDRRDWRADAPTLASAKTSAASQPGIVILADMSSLRGDAVHAGPGASRADASACAGFSELGRAATGIRRTIIYIPDTSYIAALLPISKKDMRDYRDVPDRLKAWWNNEGTRTRKRALYGPSIFYRPEMEMAVGRLAPDPEPASLAMGLSEAANDLMAIPGRKTLIVFSEFLGDDPPQRVRDALAHLRAEFGTSLTVIFVYGDTDANGLALAKDLANEAGSGPAWNGCLLLNNNAYFEQYVRSIFR